MLIDQAVYAYLANKINTNSVVVDVGAYNGNVSRMLCKDSGGNPSKYYLIEPCPDNFKVLSKRSKGYNLFNIAIASHNGTTNLFIANHGKSDGSSQGNSIFEGFVRKNAWCKDVNKLEIKCVTLDKFLIDNKIEHVDFLKLNCEGGEYAIFSSDLDFLKRTTHIYLQLHGKYKDFLTKKAIKQKMSIANQLTDSGFSIVIGDKIKDIPKITGHIHQLWSH